MLCGLLLPFSFYLGKFFNIFSGKVTVKLKFMHVVFAVFQVFLSDLNHNGYPYDNRVSQRLSATLFPLSFMIFISWRDIIKVQIRKMRVFEMRKYDKGFKKEAVKLPDEVGVNQAAAQFGIPYYSLFKRPKKPSQAALSIEQPFVDMDRIKPIPSKQSIIGDKCTFPDGRANSVRAVNHFRFGAAA